jgi:hypothetical protein
MSHASPASRPTRARRAALALALVVGLGACSHQRSIPDTYGETTESNFTEGCEGALTESSGSGEALSNEDAGNVCECAYEAISGDGGVPYEEFKQITEDQEEEPSALPEALAEPIETCRREADLS